MKENKTERLLIIVFSIISAIGVCVAYAFGLAHSTKATITENSKIHTKVDKVVSDTDLKAKDALIYLNNNNFDGDGENNLVVLDYDSPTELNEQNFLGHFIFGLASNHVQHVISNGKLIVKNRIIQTVIEEEILQFTNEQAARLWKKL